MAIDTLFLIHAKKYFRPIFWFQLLNWRDKTILDKLQTKKTYHVL